VRYVLAIDLGTSGAKVGLVGDDGDVVASEFEATSQILLPGGGAEQRPDEWWQAVLHAADRLLARQLVPRDHIFALAVSAQWSGTVPVDRQGRALGNAITWMDARGARHVRQLTGGLVSVMGYAPGKALRWIRRTGGAPTHSGKDSLAHILLIKNEQPALYEQTHNFLEPKDYLNARLTGRLMATYDSIALHWVTDNRDPAAIKYDPGLLRLCGIAREKLPELGAATDVLGPLLPALCTRWGLGKDVVVAGGSPDVHAAAIGAGTTRNFVPHLYVGTSSWLTCHTPRKHTDILHNMAALPAALPGRYLLLNEQETAGACLSQLRDQVFYADDALGTGSAPADCYRRFDQAAAQAPAGCRKLVFLPWLYGERSPVEDPHLRGAFFNYALGTTRGEMIRAVLEGVACNSRWLLRHVEAVCGGPTPELRFIGGGARSDLWCQIFADVLDRPIARVAQPLEANLRGAGLLGFLALGQLRADDLHQVVKTAQHFSPRRENRGVYDDLFATFLHLHRTTRGTFARLNGDRAAR
jgi:xylulokinase